ncbi:hypothetical protein TNCV_3762481 [Trichonephila clavipes]|nr:hypothetical protein TNCV_3762481 [Trichonephila clavipes]
MRKTQMMKSKTASVCTRAADTLGSALLFIWPQKRSLGRRGQASVPANLPDNPTQSIALDMLYPMHFAHLFSNWAGWFCSCHVTEPHEELLSPEVSFALRCQKDGFSGTAFNIKFCQHLNKTPMETLEMLNCRQTLAQIAEIHTSRRRRKRPQFWQSNDWDLLHDNALAHGS